MHCLSNAIPVRFHKASSSSATDIWQFTLNEGRLFAKVFADPQSGTNKSGLGVEYEHTVYRYITDTIDDRDPFFDHFIRLYCYMSRKTAHDLFTFVRSVTNQLTDRQLASNLQRNLSILQCGKPTARPGLLENQPLHHKDIPDCLNNEQLTDRFNVMVTQAPKDPYSTMFDFLAREDITDADRADVLSMLVLCMQKMHRLQLTHNDQHWDNVLVAERRQSVTRVYPSGVQITSRFYPVLFDWDFAQKKDGAPNPYLRKFERLFVPDAYDPLRDWFNFAYSAVVGASISNRLQRDLLSCLFHADSVHRACTLFKETHYSIQRYYQDFKPHMEQEPEENVVRCLLRVLSRHTKAVSLDSTQKMYVGQRVYVVVDKMTERFHLSRTGRISPEFDKWSSMDDIHDCLHSVYTRATRAQTLLQVQTATLYLATGAVRAYRAGLWNMARKTLIAYTMDMVVREFTTSTPLVDYHMVVRMLDDDEYTAFPSWDDPDTYVTFWMNATIYLFADYSKTLGTRTIQAIKPSYSSSHENLMVLEVSPIVEDTLGPSNRPMCTPLTLYNSTAFYCFTDTRKSNMPSNLLTWVLSKTVCAHCGQIRKFDSALQKLPWDREE